MTKSRKKTKTTRPFSMVPDDVVRSPLLTASEFRLYSILLSYCAKTTDVKQCEVANALLATHMGMAPRSVTRLARKLQKLGLVRIDYEGNGQQRAIYTINVDPPESICPDEFKGRQIKTAITYVRQSGGPKKFQKNTRAPRPKKSKRTGWPDKRQKSSATTTEPSGADEEAASLVASTPDTGVMGLGLEPLTPLSGPPDTVVRGPMTPVSSRYRENDQSTSERPNGLRPRRDIRPLGSRKPLAANSLGEDSQEVHREFRAAATALVEEEDEMGMSKEQLEAERARKRALLGGDRDQVSDLQTAESSARKQAQKAVSEASRSKGKLTPMGLYTTFRDAVQEKYPKAILARQTDGRYLKWGKSLIRIYSEEVLNEMIKVLVLDYENIDRAPKVFLKFSGTPHPTFEQFHANAPLLEGLVGVGVIAPPSVRHSPYADDYAKRHRKQPVDGADDSDDDDDEIAAIREQVHG